MPNSKQALKRQRQNDKRKAENKTVRTAMRTAIKKVVQADSSEEAQKHLPMAMKRIDKAARKNVIHANTAARYKSRIAKSAAKASS